MNNIQINMLDKLPSEVEAMIENGHEKDEKEKGFQCGYRTFALTLSYESNLVGALSAYTAWSEIYVDDIWIKKEYRGKGLGKKLLDELESKFKGQGYNNINLVTSLFQAREFYIKCGFEIEFERINKHNPQLSKTFFIKYFKETPQHKGVLPS